MPKPKLQIAESDWLLVPIIIRDDKRIGVTLAELANTIKQKVEVAKGERGNDGDFLFTHEVPVDGQPVPVKIRICCGYRCHIPETWTCALIVFNTRADGICHHVKASNGRGGSVRGWHRHEWDPAKKTCKDLRNPLPNFEAGNQIETFIDSACAVMNVILELGWR